jgi:hypothetical protein
MQACSGELRFALYWALLCGFWSGEVRFASYWALLCGFWSGEVHFASYWALLCGFWSGEVHSGLLYAGSVLATRSVGGSDMIPPCQQRHGISLDACYQGGTRKPWMRLVLVLQMPS